jgi:beta-N-acetylhexosaminidase
MNLTKTLHRREFLHRAAIAGGVTLACRFAPAAPNLAAMSLEEKVGQLIIARLPDWPLMERYARQGLIGGLTPSLQNKSPAEVVEFTNRFQRLSKYPLLIGWGGVSYSGGTEVRLGQAMRLAATRSADLCYQAARIEALESRALGFHLAGTPNVDVNTNPQNPIINLRSLGDRVELVVELGAELCRGTIDGHAAPILMHFPGHGATSGDSHIAIPEVHRSRAELEAVDLRPFAELVRRGLARVVCTNHCCYPALEPEPHRPATLSRTIITGLLRERLGFDGVIMSDSLTMRAIKDNYGIEEAAILTLAAGHDLILQDYQSDPRITIDALARAVRQGRVALAQVEASLRRVWKLKQSLGLLDDRLADPQRIADRLATAEHQAVARRIARESVTLLDNRGLPVRAGQRLLVVSNGSANTVEQDLAWKHSPTNRRLHEELRRRAPDAASLVLSADVKPDEVARAAEAAASADVVVFGLFTRVRSYAEDAIRLHPRYRELIERVVASGRRVALLNFGNPWVLADLRRPAAALCTFSDAGDSIDAAVAVLFGELKPRGKLPVRISDKYPFGFGLEG